MGIILFINKFKIFVNIINYLSNLSVRLSNYFAFEHEYFLLKYFDFDYSNKGKTSGSRVIFESENHGCIMLHKPHPQKELKAYQIKQLIEYLEQEDLI